MPYIKKQLRKLFDQKIEELSEVITNEGELNYVLTLLARQFAEFKGGNYAAYNTTVGVLESAKLEFYRRAVAPYEDQKILENGDVYV